METCDNQSVIAFDRLYTTNHIQILKVLLPFVDPSAQKNMIILIKFLELQYTLSYIGQSGALGAASRQTHPGGSAPFDIVQIFEQIRNFCTPTEQAVLEQLANLKKGMEMYREMTELMQMFSQSAPEGAPDMTPGADPMDLLRGMLSDEQQALFERFQSAARSREDG